MPISEQTEGNSSDEDIFTLAIMVLLNSGNPLSNLSPYDKNRVEKVLEKLKVQLILKETDRLKALDFNEAHRELLEMYAEERKALDFDEAHRELLEMYAEEQAPPSPGSII